MKQTFLDYYAEQFDAGAPNKENYLECASYLEGLRDGLTQELSDEAIARLIRCESLLRGAANMISHMRRLNVTEATPDNGEGSHG